jgi:hypothetical protein
MPDTITGRYPDITTAFENFFRNMIRAAAAYDKTNDVFEMVDDFMEIGRQLSNSGKGVYLDRIFKQAIINVIGYDREGRVLEAQMAFALSGVKHLVELTAPSRGQSRTMRLSRSSKRLQNSMEWLDDMRKFDLVNLPRPK